MEGACEAIAPALEILEGGNVYSTCWYPRMVADGAFPSPVPTATPNSCHTCPPPLPEASASGSKAGATHRLWNEALERGYGRAVWCMVLQTLCRVSWQAPARTTPSTSGMLSQARCWLPPSLCPHSGCHQVLPTNAHGLPIRTKSYWGTTSQGSETPCGHSSSRPLGSVWPLIPSLPLFSCKGVQLRASYRAYDHMDEICAAYSLAFSPFGDR